MKNSTHLMFGLLLAAAVTWACSGGDGPGKPDVATADLGAGDLAAADGGSDGAALQRPCTEVLQCARGCNPTDTSCYQSCRAQGTQQAVQRYLAMVSCVATVVQSGACKTLCPDPSNLSIPCQTCTYKACAKEYTACFTDFGGSSLAGFGDACNPAQPTCKSGLICASVSGTAGFCTATCTQTGQVCPGAPPGSGAVCIMGDSSAVFMCGFVCKLPGQQFKCPSTLKCDPQENPAGSGQHACLP